MGHFMTPLLPWGHVNGHDLVGPENITQDSVT